MSIDIETFRSVANSAFFTSRDIKIEGEGSNATAKLGNFIFSAGKKANAAVMDAFKDALIKEYGALGTHAFDAVLTSRMNLHKSLRACDVKETLSKLQVLRETRFVGEINRQLDTNPKFLQLPQDKQAAIRRTLEDAPFANCKIADCKTPADVSKMVKLRIDRAITENDGDDISQAKALGGRTKTESYSNPNEPTGLRNLDVVMESGTTSVEDRVKSGKLGTGMRINQSATNPMLLEKLKTNGVEPGFIYRNDWSVDDTHGFMADINSQESIAALDDLKKTDKAFAEKCNEPNDDGSKKTVRQQIMLAGRAHPAAIAAVSEFMLEKAVAVALGTNDKNVKVSDSVSNLAKALTAQFSDADLKNLDGKVSERKNAKVLKEAKLELFVAIRDAVMGVKKADAEYDASPIFKHFSDRHIMKLDYNENDRVFKKSAAHAGSFQRPERILTTRKPVLAQYYRLDTAQSADDISAGAVTEALANDLTRIVGVPSQELEIVRGQYSDGHPKLMLQAKFAEGYKDMEAGFIKDGRIVPPMGKDGQPQKLESLGKYKAFFLLTADRDAVGKRGQNKGFANGKFFAIDPGHSLEGNGKYLEISDDLSFKDTYGFSTKPRFKNFSVFDDDTRFAKLQGLLALRDTARAGTFKQLFDSYRTKFDPAANGISDAEKAMRTKVIAEIEKKETEFNTQLKKLMKVGGMQMELYDSLAGTDIQEGAIENIANLEKLCSPTTWVSKHGEVPLKHLEVKPETRVPWRAGVEGNNIVYHTDKPIPPKALEILKNLGSDFGVKADTDAFGVTRLVVPKDKADGFFRVFNEDKVAELTHPAEHSIRKFGGDGTLEAMQYKPFEPGVGNDYKDARPPMSKDQLPETLDFPDDTGHVVIMPKVHYETMATTSCPGFHRPRNVGELRAMMEARVHRGNEIYRALISGNVSRFEANEQNVAALAIAFHVAALKKGEMMYRGSFSVADPQGNIARWLDTNPYLYQRTSTHAKPYQALKVDGHLNMPRGFDVREGMGGLLNGMRTFHYFSLPDMKHVNDVDKGSGPNRRLFFKCETFGIFFSTIHAKRDAKSASRTEDMRTRWYEFGDVFESIAHGASLLASKWTSKTKDGIRKEDLPLPVGSAMIEAEAALRAKGLTEAAYVLLSGEVMDGAGMRQFLSNVETAIMNTPEERRDMVRDTLAPFMTRINDAVKHLSGDVNLRMGNEIMLDAKDFGM